MAKNKPKASGQTRVTKAPVSRTVPVDEDFNLMPPEERGLAPPELDRERRRQKQRRRKGKP